MKYLILFIMIFFVGCQKNINSNSVLKSKENYNWTGQKIKNYHLNQYKYPQSTFEEFLKKVEVHKNMNELFCYWFNLKETQKLKFEYKSNLKAFAVTIWINNIAINFNFPVPEGKIDDFKQQVKFINLMFKIINNHVFITKAYVNLDSFFDNYLETDLNIDFELEKLKPELEKITGKSWNKLKNITKLDLSSYQKDKLPDLINKLENLQYLYVKPSLKLDNLSEKIKQAIFNTDKKELEKITGKSWNELKTMKNLNLNSKNLNHLPISIGGLKQLTLLSLSWNNLKTLPESITELENLNEIYLSGNLNLDLEDTFEKLSRLKRLKELNILANNITNLPASIAKLKHLTSLALSGNKLTEIPEAIGELRNLNFLDLNNNKLKYLPDSIGKLKNLDSIYLLNNNLQKLPETIKNLKKLTTLYLRNNPIMNNYQELKRIQSWFPGKEIIK